MAYSRCHVQRRHRTRAGRRPAVERRKAEHDVQRPTKTSSAFDCYGMSVAEPTCSKAPNLHTTMGALTMSSWSMSASIQDISLQVVGLIRTDHGDCDSQMISPYVHLEVAFEIKTSGNTALLMNGTTRSCLQVVLNDFYAFRPDSVVEIEEFKGVIERSCRQRSNACCSHARAD